MAVTLHSPKLRSSSSRSSGFGTRGQRFGRQAEWMRQVPLTRSGSASVRPGHRCSARPDNGAKPVQNLCAAGLIGVFDQLDDVILGGQGPPRPARMSPQPVPRRTRSNAVFKFVNEGGHGV